MSRPIDPNSKHQQYLKIKKTGHPGRPINPDSAHQKRLKAYANGTIKPRNWAKNIPASTVEAIIARIALGETLIGICREPGMPNESTLRHRINQSYSWRTALREAQEQRTLRWAEEITDIADDGSNDWMEREGRNGRTWIGLNDDHVRRSQLRIATRQWLLARLMPAQFGDHIQHTGANGGPIQIEHSVSPSMLSNLAALRAQLPARQPDVIDLEPAAPPTSNDPTATKDGGNTQKLQKHAG